MGGCLLAGDIYSIASLRYPFSLFFFFVFSSCVYLFVDIVSPSKRGFESRFRSLFFFPFRDFFFLTLGGLSKAQNLPSQNPNQP